jgi:hypothetical protein
LSSRPKRSEGTCGSLHPQHLSLESATLKLVIPTEVEGSAVLFRWTNKSSIRPNS